MKIQIVPNWYIEINTYMRKNSVSPTIKTIELFYYDQRTNSEIPQTTTGLFYLHEFEQIKKLIKKARKQYPKMGFYSELAFWIENHSSIEKEIETLEDTRF